MATFCRSSSQWRKHILRAPCRFQLRDQFTLLLAGYFEPGDHCSPTLDLHP
jgi:hypothetical protein